MPTCLQDVAPNLKGKKKKKKTLPPMFQMQRMMAGDEEEFELVEKKASNWEKAAKKSNPGEGRRFKALAKDVGSPALAAWIGRKKYGKEGFKKLSQKGKGKKKEQALAAGEEEVQWVLEAKGGKKYLSALFAAGVLGKRTSKPGKSTVHKGAGKYARRSYRITKMGGGEYSVKREKK
jgi:hypothetical protein